MIRRCNELQRDWPCATHRPLGEKVVHELSVGTEQLERIPRRIQRENRQLTHKESREEDMAESHWSEIVGV